MSFAKPPVDTYYYDVLNVPTDAEYLVIKKAYKKLAIKYHPDKNKAPDAEEKFKIVSEAYQVLGSIELRAQYDKKGRYDGLQPTEGFVDPCVQFQHMYGGDKFKNIIGELNIGHFFVQESLDKTDDRYQAVLEATEYRQTERVSKLASILKEKLSAYTSERLSGQYSTEHQPSSFEKEIQHEANDLAQSSYGNSFLFVVGRLYSSKAKEHIGIKRAGGLPGVYYTMKEKKYITKSLWKTVKASMDSQTVEKNSRLAEAQQDFDLQQELEELCVSRCYQALWQMVKFEVEATLRKVCEMLLQDKSVNASERLLRAEGLLVLGKIYESSANISEPENEVVQLI
ncbi:X-domain of DnaJ-containing-domain-containing protein [Absidia repens]|uniref:X-domain of DnaJ-containing-domain-containing protein n=1 Tax=Absidia repens TaxID=90262 RepID=A0A1X2IGX0_9FUNG|nr:X-domain of DnaJ-containing-domain-containing protein [Absidia repens]